MTANPVPTCPDKRAKLRLWLVHVADSAITWLDELDAAETDLEPDGEDEIVTVDDLRRRA